MAITPPDMSTVGKDPQMPLPMIPEAHLDAQYAFDRAQYFAQLASAEHRIPLYGGGPDGNPLSDREIDGILPEHRPAHRGKHENTEQYQGLLAKARGYQEEALRTSEANDDYMSYVATGDLAAGGLADHLHLQKVLGFKDTTNVKAGLTDAQSDKVDADMAAASYEIDTKEKLVSNSMQLAVSSQTLFIASSREVSSHLSGVVVAELQAQINQANADKAAINKKIQKAINVANKIESGVKLAISIVKFDPKEAVASVKAIGSGVADLAKAPKDPNAPEQPEMGYLAKLVKHFQDMKYEEEFKKIEERIKEATLLQDVSMDVKSQQHYQAIIGQLKGHLEQLKAHVQAAAIHAKALTDHMRSKPKKAKSNGKQKPDSQSAQAATEAADAKDPVKRVEIFMTSAMATSGLLHGAIGAGQKARDSVMARQHATLRQRANSYWSGGRNPYQNWNEKAPPTQYHMDDGSNAADAQMLIGMAAFTWMWVNEAEKHEKNVQQISSQARNSMKEG